MFDEVQCGIGRTGKLFAHEWAGVEPDILAAAKGLGGGFPVGACLANEKAAAVMGAGSHGSTFGGNPLAMAVAGGVLDIILADGFLERVQAIGTAFRGRLEAIAKAHPKVLSEVRGKGLMLGLKCVVENTALSAKLFEKGLVNRRRRRQRGAHRAPPDHRRKPRRGGRRYPGSVLRGAGQVRVTS